MFVGGITLSDKKIKILTLGDHPLLPSGVGTQSKYVFEALLETGKFQIMSFGGAIEHPDYKPQITQKWGEDWIISPVKGYGNQQQIRQCFFEWKPDILWFMTDPRFYEWLWQMEDEIRECVPMVYYHVWDNYPYPKFNDVFYSSNDVIATISKVTSDIVQNVSPHVQEQYIPHAVHPEIFKPIRGPAGEALVENLKKDNNLQDKFVFFWNNRNARRKQSGSVIFWFKEFLDIVGHDKASLIMHTDLNDPHGQPLGYLIEQLGMTDGQVNFSTSKIPPEQMNLFYNMADCTINISDAEGFGLATLESLYAGTPIIATMTGGLQEQVTDGENWFGVGIEPASKAVIGSQQVPYINEDRVSEQDVVDALLKMYNMSKEDREALGEAGRQHVLKNYGFEDFKSKWVNLMTEVHEKYGSWDTRKDYRGKWELIEL